MQYPGVRKAGKFTSTRQRRGPKGFVGHGQSLQTGAGDFVRRMQPVT